MDNVRAGGFSKKPRALMCYICGREYGTTSLQIHLKTCMKKWDIEESKKPRKDRRPMPQPPKQLVNVLDRINAGGRVDWEAMDTYNEKANDKWNEEALIRCEYCNRTFLPDRLTIHRKICTPDKPFKPLPPIRGGASANSINSLSSVSTSASNNAKGISNRTPSERGTYGAAADEQSAPKGNTNIRNLNAAAAEKNRSSLNVKASYGQGQSSVNSKIGKSSSSSSQMMVQNSRPNNAQPKVNNAQGIQGKRRVETKNINYLLSGNMGAAEHQQLDLQPCDLCGRRFASDRIERHQKACLRFQKGDAKHSRKVAQAERKRIENERFVAKEAKYKKSKWREQHKELIEGLRYGRKIQAVQQRGGDIRSLGPAPKVSGVEQNLKECPYCYRRFNPQSAEKHINICQNVINKPKPVPSKSTSYKSSGVQSSYYEQEPSSKPYLNSLRGNLRIKEDKNVAKSYDLSSSYEPYGGNQGRLSHGVNNNNYDNMMNQTCQGFKITREPMKLATQKGAGGLINESIEVRSSPKRVTKGGGFGMSSPGKKTQVSSISDNVTPIQSNVRNINVHRINNRYY